MPHFYDRQYRDYSKELSTARINISVITVGTIVGVLANIANYKAALDDIVLGTPSMDMIIMDRTVLSGASPTDVFAQRELKWLVHYHGDTTGKKYTHEIPCANPTANLVPGTDLMDLTATDPATWKTAFEGIVVAPDDDTETVTIDYVELVGRNI